MKKVLKIFKTFFFACCNHPSFNEHLPVLIIVFSFWIGFQVLCSLFLVPGFFCQLPTANRNIAFFCKMVIEVVHPFELLNDDPGG